MDLKTQFKFLGRWGGRSRLAEDQVSRRKAQVRYWSVIWSKSDFSMKIWVCYVPISFQANTAITPRQNGIFIGNSLLPRARHILYRDHNHGCVKPAIQLPRPTAKFDSELYIIGIVWHRHTEIFGYWDSEYFKKSLILTCLASIYWFRNWIWCC